MTAKIYTKPPRRVPTGFSLSPNVIAMVKKAAKKNKVPASRLVEAILRERLGKENEK